MNTYQRTKFKLKTATTTLPEKVCKQDFSTENTSLLQNSIAIESCLQRNMPPAENYVPAAPKTNGIRLHKTYANNIKVNTSFLTPEIASSTFVESWTTKPVIPKEQSEITDFATFLNLSLKTISKIVHESMQIYKRIAFQLSVHVQCKCSSDTERPINHESLFIEQNKSLTSQEVVLNSTTEIEDSVDIITSLLAMDNAEQLSKYAIIEKFHLDVTIRELPKRIGSHLNLPVDIRGVVNTRNFDNFCFKWAVIAAVAKKCLIGNLYQINLYKIKDITQEKIHTSGVTLDFSGLHFPVNYWDLRIFENRNKEISLNVFGFEVLDNKRSKIIGPLYRTKKRRPGQIHINLLYFGNEENGVCHYAYIKNMSNLLQKQITENTALLIFCNKCLSHFICQYSLDRHKCEVLNVLW